MKKLCYPFLFLSSVALAQEVPGYHPENGYAYENFGRKTEYANVKWTSQEPKEVRIDSLDETTAEACLHPRRTFSYTIQRDSVNKKGKIVLNQPYSEYQPFGIMFKKNTKGKQRILNLSQGNALFSFRIKNTSPYDLNIYLSMIDSLGKIADCVGPNKNNEAYKDQTVFWRLQPGQDTLLTLNYNKNAFDAQWNDSSITCGPANYSGVDTTFNKSIVSGALFTIVNSKTAEGFDAYKSYPLVNASFELSEIKIGKFTNMVTALPSAEQRRTITVFPNPAKEVLHFSEPLQDIVLTDLSGNVVAKNNAASQLDISGFSQGIYLLKSTSLQQPCKVVIE